MIRKRHWPRLPIDHVNGMLEIVVFVIVQLVQIVDAHQLLGTVFPGALVLQVSVDTFLIQAEISRFLSAVRSIILPPLLLLQFLQQADVLPVSFGP